MGDDINKVHKEILQVVDENPGINQKGIVSSVDKPKSTVSKRVGFLLEQDYITDKKGWKDNATEYHLHESVSLGLDMNTTRILDYRVILNFLQLFLGVLLYLNYPEQFNWIGLGLLVGLVPNVVYTIVELYNNGELVKIKVSKKS